MVDVDWLKGNNSWCHAYWGLGEPIPDFSFEKTIGEEVLAPQASYLGFTYHCLLCPTVSKRTVANVKQLSSMWAHTKKKHPLTKPNWVGK